MIWLLVAVYLLAGVTIGRMCYEFDVFAPDRPGLETMADRRADVGTCCLIALIWFVVPVAGLVNHLRGSIEE